jgi:hypothetical protein
MAVKVREKTPPRRVDFFFHAEDLMVVMLANIGLYDVAIAQITGLSLGQVRYRLLKAEEGRRKGEPTARTKYRTGTSDVVQSVIKTVVGKNSQVKKTITDRLDKKGLFEPRPTGVMKHDKKLVLSR